MNKIKIIMPIVLVAPILFGCNQNKSTYSLAFHSDYCELLNNKGEYSKKEPETVTLTMKLKEEYQYCAVPNDVIILFGKTEGVKGENYTYTLNDPNEKGEAKSATITLEVTDNINITAKFSDSDNAFRIDPNKYDEAIDLNGSDTKYVQREYVSMIITAGIVSGNFLEDYVSPTVYSYYARQVYSSSHQSPAEQYYVEKSGDNYYKYKRESMSTPWIKETTDSRDFRNPASLSFRGIIELNKIDYDTIKNEYDPQRQAYYINAEVKDGQQTYACEIIMSFYNSKLTFFSYSYDNTEYNQLKFGTVSYTYGAITPKLPKVN